MPGPRGVLVAPSILASRQTPYLARLEAAGLEIVRNPLGRPYGEAELIEGLGGVFATIAGGKPYTERVFEEAAALLLNPEAMAAARAGRRRTSA